MKRAWRSAAREAVRFLASFLEHPLLVLATLLPSLVVRFIVASVPGNYDGDCWWIAAAGREMLRTGAVPRENAFSFVDGNEPWIMHEWLLGPLYAWGLEHLGIRFLALVPLVVGGVALSIAFAAIVRESRSTLSAWMSAAIVVVAYTDRFTSARPTGVSLLFPIAMLALVLRPMFGPREVALSGLLMLVWTNAHGSFPLGLVMLGFATITQDDKRYRALALVLGAIATLFNPYGLRLYGFVLHYLAGDAPVFAVIHQWIAEFSPLWRARAWQTPPVAFGLSALGLLTFLGLSRRETRLRALASAVLLVLGVKNVRHLELAGILTAMLLVPVTNTLAARLGGRAAVPRWFRWTAAGAACAVFVLWGLRARTHPDDDALLRGYRPAMSLATTLPDHAHVFAPFNAAPLITWVAYPRGVLTFADPRNDCFRASTLETLLCLDTGSFRPGTQKPDPGRVFDTTGTTHVLLDEDHPLFAQMELLPGWHRERRQGIWTLFARNVAEPGGL